MKPRLQSLVDPRSPFDALLEAARDDAGAAEGLALAYGELDAEGRRHLCELVARTRDGSLLALLLAVEPDTTLAGEIAARIASLGRDVRAWRWGDRARGGLLVTRPLFGSSVQALGLAWDADTLQMVGEPLTDSASLASVRTRLGAPETCERVGCEEALDDLAERLWRWTRAGGSLPEDVRALAHFFAPPSREAP